MWRGYRLAFLLLALTAGLATTGSALAGAPTADVSSKDPVKPKKGRWAGGPPPESKGDKRGAFHEGLRVAKAGRSFKGFHFYFVRGKEFPKGATNPLFVFGCFRADGSVSRHAVKDLDAKQSIPRSGVAKWTVTRTENGLPLRFADVEGPDPHIDTVHVTVTLRFTSRTRAAGKLTARNESCKGTPPPVHFKLKARTKTAPR
jgi:hypothetical protein